MLQIVAYLASRSSCIVFGFTQKEIFVPFLFCWRAVFKMVKRCLNASTDG